MEDARANVIECPCGVLLEGESSDDVAAKAQVHAKETHDGPVVRAGAGHGAARLRHRPGEG